MARSPGEYNSPLAPTMAQAVGFNDRRDFNAREGSAPEEGNLVAKGHAKNSMADPSVGTATSRPQTMERSGARYRIHPLTTSVNQPYSGATQSTGRVVNSEIATDYAGTGDYGGGEEAAFDDAAVVAGYTPAYHRVRGWTNQG